MTRRSTVQAAVAVSAASLVAAAGWLPLWSLEMEAPQYPKGLHLYAYGTGMTGDVGELNILNHYIGMPPIEAPTFETSMFPVGIAILIALCLFSPLARWIRMLAVGATAATPLAIVVDLQWRLYAFGHSLNPSAPIRLKPFTPLVIGESKMGNFESSGMVSWGFFCLVLAAALLLLSRRIADRLVAHAGVGVPPPRVEVAATLAFLVAAPSLVSAQTSLQHRLDAAPRGSTVVVERGVYHGRIVIRGPLTVIGQAGAVIDGDGIGSVVTLEGDDVTLRGLTVRNSGREVTEEAAGIKATGNRHRIEANVVSDVYFGIHIGGGRGAIVQDNVIAPGESHGARPGHGISTWNLTDSHLLRNRISHARDGIYLSFTERLVVAANVVSGCRYGLHSMYSQQARFEHNTVRANLLGAALMMSDRLVLRGNRIEEHRKGPAAYGVLLKDIGDLIADGNDIVANRVGIYAEGVPSNPSREAIVSANLIAGNEVGLALQSNAALTVAGNRIAENLTDVRPLGNHLAPSMRWSHNGRGNSWGQYRGYDADGNGVGDVPHTVEDGIDALLRRNEKVQSFLYTPAHLALEAAARLFPLYRRQPLVVDNHPLMSPDRRGSR